MTWMIMSPPEDSEGNRICPIHLGFCWNLRANSEEYACCCCCCNNFTNREHIVLQLLWVPALMKGANDKNQEATWEFVCGTRRKKEWGNGAVEKGADATEGEWNKYIWNAVWCCEFFFIFKHRMSTWCFSVCWASFPEGWLGAPAFNMALSQAVQQNSSSNGNWVQVSSSSSSPS